MKWLLLGSVLCGCSLFDEHGSGGPGGFTDAPGSLPSPPDARDPLCGGLLMCGPDRHCEAQCQPAGTAGCMNRCHVACVPDTPCSAVDCGTEMTCVDTGVNDCFGMVWQTNQQCVPTTSTVRGDGDGDRVHGANRLRADLSRRGLQLRRGAVQLRGSPGPVRALSRDLEPVAEELGDPHVDEVGRVPER